MNRLVLQCVRALAAGIALLALAVVLGQPTRGFTINQTTAPANNLKWFGSDMPATWLVNMAPPAGTTSAEWLRTFKKSMKTWTILPGSDLTFAVAGTTTAGVDQLDNKTVLCAISSGWSHGSGVLAITHYYFLSNGQITGDDMEFNSQDFTWSAAFTDERANHPTAPADTAYDLQSIMTHELGHSIGFGHSLDGTGVPTTDPNYDDNGTPTTADDQINGPNQNTMDPATLKGETFQRSLAPDDIAAMTANYPAASTALLRPSAFVLEPDGVGDNPAGGSFTIQWLGQYEGTSNPAVSFYYTQNITEAGVAGLTGATLIAAGVASPRDGSTASYLWTFNSVPAGNYYIIAVVTADGITTKDISPGVVTVSTPVLTLTAPTLAGITLVPYSSAQVTWTSSGSDLGPVKIDLSRDNGATFSQVITGGTANTGSYFFTVPDPVVKFGAGPQTTCKIRISYLNDASVKDVSANAFTIALAQDSLALLAPNGGEFLTAGATTFISFNAAGPLVGDDFEIQYSPDLGTTWFVVETAKNIPGVNPRNYAWVVPGAFSSTSLIRVRSVTTRYFVDVSDSPFSIGPNGTSALTAVPANLTFDVMQGGANPANQSVAITNDKASTPINGLNSTRSITNLTTPGMPTTVPSNAPAIVPVALDTTGLTAGTINATLTIKGTGVADLTIPVTIHVQPLGATAALTYNPTALNFTATPGGLSPGSQSLSVNNPAGNVTSTVDVTTTDAKLLIKPGRFTVNGGAGQPLTVATDTTTLASGTVKHSTVTTQATTIGSGNFQVTVTVVGAAPTGVREKNHASPCSVGGTSTGGGSGLWAVLVGVLGVGFLRWRIGGRKYEV